MINEITEQIRARCNAQAPTVLELGDARGLLAYLDEKAEPVADVTDVVAVEAGAPVEVAAAKPAPATPEQVVDLEDMTKDELLEHADSVGAEVSKSDNKADIVKAIKKAEKAKNK